VQQDLSSNSGYERKITAVGVQGKDSIHASSSSNNESCVDERKRNDLFHIRVVSKHTNIDTLFDLGSQVNLISEALVNKMGLETKPHPKPYPLGWVCDKAKLNVTNQCRIRFIIASKLIDEVDLDVVPLEKDVRTSDTFQGHDPSHKQELIDIVSKYDDIFQELDGLPPKREIQHEIHLQQDSPLPNVARYRMSVVEMTEIKK
jgi:hypothetical protein